ncbi:MAG TPA: hypothetical protein VFK05_36415 [Polyangiaceae bacterium]|nr:hypothetical protein [Polyangiaceae bacterium]
MGSRRFALALLGAFGALGCDRHPPAVVCRVSYGGEVKRLEFPATKNPYAVKAVDVADRFSLKVIYVREPWRAASINVYAYAYQGDNPGARLLQESKFAPPFSHETETRYGFTGRQLVYSADQRELDYWCELTR